MGFNRTNTDTFLGYWFWTIDRFLLAATAGLMLVGLFMVMSASPAIAERIGFASNHFVVRHVVFLILGAMIMFILSLLPQVVVRRLAFLGFMGCLVLLVAVQLIGFEANGARRWLSLGGFSLQPSEFMKPCFAVMTAWLLAKHSDNRIKGFRLATICYVLVIGLLLVQPDFGMTVAFTVMWSIQIFMAGLPWLFIILAAIFGIVGFWLAYSTLDHVASRIDRFLDPASGDNYQIAKSLEAFKQGGLLGSGPGEGVVKHRLPDAHTDFIFAVVGEEFGAIVAILLVLLFSFVLWRCYQHMKQEQDVFLLYAITGLTAQLAVQTMINMGVAVNVLPNTGMTLPFISYGGSATLAVCITMGMLLAFTRKRYG